MKKRLLLTIVLTLITPLSTFASVSAYHLPTNKPSKNSCSQQAVGIASCFAHRVYNDDNATPLATVSYTNGYAPTHIASAYKLPAAPVGTFAWNGQTVAIVDAYDNPNTASDLVAYRKQFNLPLCATTSAAPTATDLTSCFFTKVNQNGVAAPLPAGNTSWGQEIDLDLDMVSAACPSCKISLVEANSAAFADLGTGVNSAVRLGANAVSNSYGGKEFSTETSAVSANYYNHQGVAITVSSGDSGYGVEFPAASPYVTSVGGTSLTQTATTARGWTETVWKGAGSGCSKYVAALSFQTKVGTCSKRVVADVSAVADPNTGVAIYDSYGSTNGANWYVFGGTSVASPIIASVYALAGNAGGVAPAIKYGEYPYAHRANLNDVTSGHNGSCTSFFSKVNRSLCNAAVGYDGPSGLGTPNGLGAF